MGRHSWHKSCCVTNTIDLKMAANNFDAPFCLRNQANSDAHNEGFFFVDHGVLVVDSFRLTIKVYEKSEWEAKGSNARCYVTVDLTDGRTSINFRIIRSRHRTFESGRVRVNGFFDQQRGEENLTFKLSMSEYQRLRTFFSSMNPT